MRKTALWGALFWLLTGAVQAQFSAQTASEFWAKRTGSQDATSGYGYSDCVSENALGLTNGGEIAWFQGFLTTDRGLASDDIVEIAAANGNVGGTAPPAGSLGGVFVYDDPGGDNTDPTDLTAADLVSSASWVTCCPNTDMKEPTAVPAATVTDGFWSAAMLAHAPGEFPAALDSTTAPSLSRSWVTGSNTTFDPLNPGGGIGFFEMAALGFDSHWLMTSRGTGPPPTCPLPDNLDGGPCCTTTELKLPDFPAFQQDSFDICWRDCDVDGLRNCRAEWSKPFQLGLAALAQPCGRFHARLRLRDTAGQVKWKGAMRLNYSRTWVETDSSGRDYQVWRFLVNGDLSPTPNTGQGPCQVPPCAAQFNRVRHTGYIDYAQECASGNFSFAWMLTHSCDVIDHAPGFPRGGFFHPNRAYTFVGPAAGFAVGPIQPVVAGGTSLEGVRRVRLPVPGATGSLCEFEEFIDAGLEVQQELCVCGSPNGPLQYVVSDLGLGASCGTSIFTPGGPLLPGYLGMGIGAWIDPLTYPGLETLRWSSGGYDYFDPCVGVTRQEVFFGVTTLGGYFATQLVNQGPGFPLPLNFVDQANSLRSGATIMNVMFVSDHILNLNF